MPTLKTTLQVAASIAMVVLVGALLYWQEVRYQLVGECQARGGQWDGPSGRCRPVPEIYIQRELQRS